MAQVVKCDLYLYAYDSCLVYTGWDIYAIEDTLNIFSNSLCNWFVENKLSIHFGEDKTKSIIFGSKRRLKDRHTLDIRRGEIEIKQHKEVKYLVCIFDCNTSGEAMAVKILNKVNSRLRFLYRKQSILNVPLTHLLCTNSAPFWLNLTGMVSKSHKNVSFNVHKINVFDFSKSLWKRQIWDKILYLISCPSYGTIFHASLCSLNLEIFLNKIKSGFLKTFKLLTKLQSTHYVPNTANILDCLWGIIMETRQIALILYPSYIIFRTDSKLVTLGVFLLFFVS